MDVYQNDRYNTKDNIIPFKLFWLFSRAMKHNMAMERITNSQSVAFAIGMAMSGGDPSIKRMGEQEIKDALGTE
jgi:hypothetical protein